MDLDDLDLAPETLFLLWAARETGALDAVTGDADDPAAVAEGAGITDRAADLIVSALEREGFLERVGDAHEPTNRMLGFLAAADLRSVGRLPAALDTLDALAALPETMQTGEPPVPSADEAVEDRLTHRLGARDATDEATVRAVTTAAVRQAPDAERVLDVGGAPGHYARAFAELGLDATLADRPDAVERSARLLAPTDVETAGVPPDGQLPDADLVFAGDVARRRDPSGAARLVERLAAAAEPSGTVAVADVLADRSDRAVPAGVAAYARDGGGVYGEERFADWFADAGLDAPTVEAVPGTDRQVIAATIAE